MAFSFNGNTPKVITFNNQDVKKLIWGNTVVWEKQKLPSQYQEVEYIEGTGTQYIDTRYYPNQDTKFEMRYYILEAGCSPAGVRWTVAPNSQTFGFFASTSIGTTCYFGRANDNKYVTFANKNEYSQIADGLLDITRVSINTFSATVSRDQFVSTFPMYLFSLNIMGEASSPSKMRLYSASISESGAVKREFIPCYRKIDKKPGLYDAFNDVFYTNDGTGEFNVGADIIILPANYQRVEYIESSGTQYIDTGKNIDLADDIELTFSVNTNSYSNAAKFRIFGAQSGNNIFQMNMLVNVGCLNIFKKSISTVAAGYTYLQYPNSSTALTNGTIYTVKTNGLTILVNGTTLGTLAQSVTTGEISNSAMTIFARRNAGTVDSIADCGMKCYGFKRWDGNGSLVQNLIPCYRKSDGVIGMYDLVSATFFTNSGTGTFIKGADI